MWCAFLSHEFERFPTSSSMQLWCWNICLYWFFHHVVVHISLFFLSPPPSLSYYVYLTQTITQDCPSVFPCYMRVFSRYLFDSTNLLRANSLPLTVLHTVFFRWLHLIASIWYNTMAGIPTVKFSNGHEMPMLGLGTYKGKKTVSDGKREESH